MFLVMRNDVYHPEPPSVVESESGWAEKHPVTVGENIKEEDFVVLDSIGLCWGRILSF